MAKDVLIREVSICKKYMYIHVCGFKSSTLTCDQHILSIMIVVLCFLYIWRPNENLPVPESEKWI